MLPNLRAPRKGSTVVRISQAVVVMVCGFLVSSVCQPENSGVIADHFRAFSDKLVLFTLRELEAIATLVERNIPNLQTTAQHTKRGAVEDGAVRRIFNREESFLKAK